MLTFCLCSDLYGVVLCLSWSILDSHGVALSDVGVLEMVIFNRSPGLSHDARPVPRNVKAKLTVTCLLLDNRGCLSLSQWHK